MITISFVFINIYCLCFVYKYAFCVEHCYHLTKTATRLNLASSQLFKLTQKR